MQHMAVLCEAISIVVPVTALQERFPGGLRAYSEAAPNRTFCCDGSVARIGLLAPDDARAWLDMLAGHDLRADGDAPAVAVVDQVRGLLSHCDWLSTASDGSLRVAWRTGEDPARTYLPEGWTREAHEALTHLPQQDLASLEVLADGQVRTLRDPSTGRLLHQGRVLGGATDADSD